MTNPVLARSAAFTQPAQPQQFGYGQPQQYGYGQVGAPYGQPGASYGQPGAPYGQPYAPGGYQPQGGYEQYAPPQPTWQTPVEPPAVQKVMTLDDVLTKTALTLGTTVVVAVMAMSSTKFLGWPMLASAGMICGLATIIFPFVAAARRRVSPALAITFAVLEGVFIGAISAIFEIVHPGIVKQAVVSTFVAAGLTLAAFHYGKFRLSSKMRKIVMMSTFAYLGVVLVNLLLSFFGVHLGLFPGPHGEVSAWAWLAAGVGVVLAVLSLVDDFQFIEYGIAQRLPATESWRAAYGLTVTLVWLYVNLLRILSYIRR